MPPTRATRPTPSVRRSSPASPSRRDADATTGAPDTDPGSDEGAPSGAEPVGAAGDGTTVEQEAAVAQDGRHARRDRNKYAVVDAYLQLVREGDPRPSIAAVADRSGVSHRSVFRYFADKDELARTAIERQHAFANPLVPLTVGPGAPLPERIDRFVERRLDLFEAIAPVARLSRSLAMMQPVLDQELSASRTFLRSQIRHLFRAEIDALEPADRAPALAALDALCSFESVDLLRRDQGFDRAAAAAALRYGIARLLA